MKRLLFIFFATVLSMPQSLGQSADMLEATAERELMRENYLMALEYYRLAFSKDTSRTSTAIKIAAISMNYNLYEEAMNWYELICSRDQDFALQSGLYNLAAMQKSNGLYNEAISNFTKYSKKGTDPELIKQSLKQIESTSKALEIIQDTHDVNLQFLDANINTIFPEFGAIQVSLNRIFFTSVQPLSLGEYNNLFPEFASIWQSKIYQSRITFAGYTKREPLPSRINRRNTHNGSISKVPGRRAYYFVRCTGDLSDERNCAIFFAEMSGNRWRRPKKLPASVNMPGYSALHPIFVRHNETSVLYFVSDRPGGHGGKDIWYSLYINGEYGDPVNLGSTINTAGDEVTPMYVEDISTLFFSSDGHAGMGGYDIFFSEGGLNAWQPVKNMGPPFNSPGNDLYFFMNGPDSSGYITSNRPHSSSQANATCCGNLYYFEWKSKDKPGEEADEPSDTIPTETRIRALLPIALYFHNDEPDPKTTKTLSERNYRETLVEYLDMQDKYVNEYSRGLKGERREKAQNDIKNFFGSYVIKGYQNLELITSWLIDDLMEGYSVSITVSGYASPLNTSQYNYNLSKRRISSFENYLYDYRDGILRPFIDGTAENNASLSIIRQPEGDSRALSFVSDNPHDKRNSIYSRSAAFERRIEIVAYETKRETGALLSWDAGTLDMGRATADTIIRKSVKILNRGKTPARLQFVSSDHDYISAVYTEDAEIAAGGSLEILIEINTRGLEQGPFHELISAGFHGVENFIILNLAAYIE